MRRTASEPKYPPPDDGNGSAVGTTRVVSGPKPAWVDGTPARYPRMTYMTGVGRGTARMPCESDSRAQIAKIFEARISQVSSDWMGHFSRVNATGKVHIEAMAVSQLTRVSTDYVLKGTMIAEVWRGEGAFHCLATLDRMQAARRLRGEIDRLDVQIAAKVSEGDKGENPTTKFFAYKAAMLLLQRREALNTELRIVSPNGMGKAPIHGWAALVAKFSASARKIKIGMKLEGRGWKQFQTRLAERLTQDRIQVMETSNNVDLFIRGKTYWKWAGINNGQYMVNIDVLLRIFNMDNGKTLGAITDRLLTGRPQKSQALITASTKLCYKVAPMLAKKIQAILAR